MSSNATEVFDLYPPVPTIKCLPLGNSFSPRVLPCPPRSASSPLSSSPKSSAHYRSIDFIFDAAKLDQRQPSCSLSELKARVDQCSQPRLWSWQELRLSSCFASRAYISCSQTACSQTQTLPEECNSNILNRLGSPGNPLRSDYESRRVDSSHAGLIKVTHLKFGGQTFNQLYELICQTKLYQTSQRVHKKNIDFLRYVFVTYTLVAAMLNDRWRCNYDAITTKWTPRTKYYREMRWIYCGMYQRVMLVWSSLGDWIRWENISSKYSRLHTNAVETSMYLSISRTRQCIWIWENK